MTQPKPADCGHEEEYVLDCDACRAAWEAEARRAGIPQSVIDGKTRLRDHFTQEFIESQANPKGEGGDHE